jgi:hypothetical protein
VVKMPTVYLKINKQTKKESYYLEFRKKDYKIRKCFGKNFLLAKKMSNILQEYRDIERAREFLKKAIFLGLCNEEQRIALQYAIDEEYKNLLSGQKEQIKIIFKELQEKKGSYDPSPAKRLKIKASL